MAWRDNLQPASFRGVPFEIDTLSGEGGRRLVVHEYPDRDTPFVEDRGRAARRFTQQAFVIGANYPAAKRRLIEALEAYGPGLLVHPVDGQRQVAVEKYATSETTAEGGCCVFSITFIEAGDQLYPAAQADTSARVARSVDDMGGIGVRDFSRVFDLRGPDFITQGALGRLRPVLDILSRGGSFLPNSPGRGQQAIGGAEYARSLRLFPGLVESGGGADAIGSGLLALFTGLRGIGGDQRRQYYAPLQGYGLADPVSARPNTASRRQAAANDSGFTGLVRLLALGESVLAGRDSNWQTYDEAITWRDDTSLRLDDEMTRAASPSQFTALVGLRSDMRADTDQRALDLPRLRRIAPLEVMPATVLAYRHFGSIEGSDQIAPRNGLRHGGFLPPRDMLLREPVSRRR